MILNNFGSISLCHLGRQIRIVQHRPMQQSTTQAVTSPPAVTHRQASYQPRNLLPTSGRAVSEGPRFELIRCEEDDIGEATNLAPCPASVLPKSLELVATTCVTVCLRSVDSG